MIKQLNTIKCYAVAMVPADMKDFMVACLGASASFIGLLFVGLSVVMQNGNQKLADTDRILAESSFTGLLNIFFICLIGLEPQPSVGLVCLIMAIIGLLNCWRLKSFSRKMSLAISAIVYALELIFSIGLVTHSKRYINTGDFEGIVTALFTISLIRAWGLTGIRSKSSKA